MLDPTQRGAVRHASVLVLCAIPLFLFGCGDDNSTSPEDDDLRNRFGLETLGPIPYPPDNPPRQERIALGRLLFFDPILGGEKDVACGTCHHPDFAFADRRQFGAGASGRGLGPSRVVSSSAIPPHDPIQLEPRNTPTCFNTAFNLDESGTPSHDGLQFWDGRAAGLEVQATMPITSRVEMAGDAYPGDVALDSVLARLQEIPEYEALFANAFPEVAARGTSAIDSSTYSRSIAAYERELVTRNSAYDRFVNGEDEALSPLQKQGLELFFGKALCSDCHSGPMFTDFTFVVQGVPQEGTGKDVISGDDTGREEHTGNPADRYAFRTPTLRNVELTPPYMHDGVFHTLDEVVRFYNDGALPRHPQCLDSELDERLVDANGQAKVLGLTEDEIAALVSFMEGLTDPGTALDPMLLTVPATVPSGLTPVFGLDAP
jgi:cytochrome c peroxidase